MKRQPEIEIYVRDCPPERLVAWIESVVGPLAPAVEAGAATVYPSRIGPVVVTPEIEDGPFVGVWFNSPDTPWATDVDCARLAAKELGCVVRCCPGQHFPEVHWWASDQFLEIAGGVEQIVTWECAEPNPYVPQRVWKGICPGDSYPIRGKFSRAEWRPRAESSNISQTGTLFACHCPSCDVKLLAWEPGKTDTMDGADLYWPMHAVQTDDGQIVGENQVIRWFAEVGPHESSL